MTGCPHLTESPKEKNMEGRFLGAACCTQLMGMAMAMAM